MAQKSDITKKLPAVVKKNIGAVSITGAPTLLQRKLWNVLLGNAFAHMATSEWFYISLQTLMRAVEYDSKNVAYLEESLTGLMRTVVSWDILGRAGEKRGWEAHTLMAGVIVDGPLVQYAFDPLLRGRLLSPEIYTRINLRLQNRFESKYGMILYEHARVFYMEKKGHGTWWVDLDRFRSIMGIEDKEYLKFSHLNNRVIAVAMAEVNAKSDLHIDVRFQKESRRVIGLEFAIKANEGFNTLLERATNAPAQLLLPLFDNGQLMAELQHVGFSEDDAVGLLQKYGPDKCSEKLELMSSKKERIKNPVAWLQAAFERDYQVPEGFKSRAQQQAERQAQEDAERKKREAEDKEREELAVAAEWSRQAWQRWVQMSEQERAQWRSHARTEIPPNIQDPGRIDRWAIELLAADMRGKQEECEP